VLQLITQSTGVALIAAAACLLPVGIASLRSDRRTTKKDVEFSTLLRSMGGMATSSGTTLKQALTKIDLTSFPALQGDIERLSTRLLARVEPDICWSTFGLESGSRLINDVTSIFYSAVKIGGDPERVGYLCSLFVARTTQLRAKRRLVGGTFSALSTVMVAMTAALLVFVLSIVNGFANLVTTLSAEQTAKSTTQNANMSLGLAQFSPQDLAFLGGITLAMVLAISIASSAAVIFTDGGMKLKMCLYLALSIFISGMSFIVIPPMVGGILAK